ncbi:peroxisomal membrane protein 11C [Agrilus planipennis]|uniref:Peroxisomal membrane protein 11C n=1 Tax=Agrilus planipennis TaxID=224129 RepID=A0A7F5R9L5_AGRPL|nr:peroxisomal membrane protein 11C [Agrilus planipennis]XP_025832657.1 peroxisomal membrane protein 11C [Agrilus planipennis]XP_025832658.1 peroxisomal membrane protein 11C [Agrilus planipennis]XP_025832659.1 peroxisomal membrane protein 11C [Agrilus planipennis]XP_025832660.1 peroxisomal membrane protein 11C [Agrilus planipennis]XP_025832661.1 peroxisomal membrane protein 11C [Agrilus planipennis]
MSNKFLNNVSNILETYKGRDKVLKTLCYGARFIGGSKKDELSTRLRRFGSEMSAARAVLRLLDDASTISYVIEYKLGQNEPDRVMAVLGFLGNLADLIYCPIDKICWLGSTKLINVKDVEYYDNINTLCWVFSVYFSLMRNLWYLRILSLTQKSLSRKHLEYSNLDKRRKYEILTCVRLTLDLLHAVNSLPPGFLWSSKFKAWQVGLIGTISGMISLFQMYSKK